MSSQKYNSNFESKIDGKITYHQSSCSLNKKNKNECDCDKNSISLST